MQSVFSDCNCIRKVHALLPMRIIMKFSPSVHPEAENDTEEYKTSAISGKINLNLEEIKQEEKNYVKMPMYYSFTDKKGKDRKEEVLMTNYRRINKEVELLIHELKK